MNESDITNKKFLDFFPKFNLATERFRLQRAWIIYGRKFNKKIVKNFLSEICKNGFKTCCVKYDKSNTMTHILIEWNSKINKTSKKFLDLDEICPEVRRIPNNQKWLILSEYFNNNLIFSSQKENKINVNQSLNRKNFFCKSSNAKRKNLKTIKETSNEDISDSSYTEIKQENSLENIDYKEENPKKEAPVTESKKEHVPIEQSDDNISSITFNDILDFSITSSSSKNESATIILNEMYNQKLKEKLTEKTPSGRTFLVHLSAGNEPLLEELASVKFLPNQSNNSDSSSYQSDFRYNSVKKIVPKASFTKTGEQYNYQKEKAKLRYLKQGIPYVEKKKKPKKNINCFISEEDHKRHEMEVMKSIFENSKMKSSIKVNLQEIALNTIPTGKIPKD